MPCIVANVISDECAQTTGAQANIPFVSDSFAHVKGFIHMPLHSKSIHIKKKKKKNERRGRDTRPVVWIQAPMPWPVWSRTDSAFSSPSCCLGSSPCFSYHFGLIIYVPIARIGSFTFNFIDVLGKRGFGESGFKACLAWLRLNIWKKCDLFRSRRAATRVFSIEMNENVSAARRQPSAEQHQTRHLHASGSGKHLN